MAIADSQLMYRSPLLSSLKFAFLTVLLFAYAWFLPYLTNGKDLVAGVKNLIDAVLCPLLGLYCLYRAIPYAMQFEPRAQLYTYSWGLGPLSVHKSGVYADLECVYVQQLTTVTGRRLSTLFQRVQTTTCAVTVTWSTEMRKVVLAYRSTIGEAQAFAAEIAAVTGVTYGGIYDNRNSVWIQGPYRKRVVAKAHEPGSTAADSVGGSVVGPSARRHSKQRRRR